MGHLARCVAALCLAEGAVLECDEGSLLQVVPLPKEPLSNSTRHSVFRTWLDWLEAAVRSEVGFDQPDGTFNASASLLATEEHGPTDLSWMTVTLGAIIALALVWAVLQISVGGEKAEKDAEGMSEVQLMFNIVKSVVGEGMLSLPAGIAGGTGLLAGGLMTMLFASLMGYTFALMGRVCHVTGAVSHKECCRSIAPSWLGEGMAVVLLVKTIFTCLAFAIVISESFSRILRFAGVHGVMASSQAALLMLTAVVLIPLCLQRQLRVLSYTSMIGCLGQVWVVFTMQIRYLDGSYRPGGQFYDSLPAKDRPDFTGGVMYWKSSVASFVLLGSLSTAFIAHYNAPKFYSQLHNATPEKFQRVVVGAFSFAMVIYLWIMAVGYLTFGASAEGLILNNYSEKDILISTARFAISFAVVFAFPLGFTGLRDSMMSTFDISQDRFRSVTFALLSMIVLGACFFHDLGLANSLGGAVLGSLITLVFPALLLYFAGRQSDKEFGQQEGTAGAFSIMAGGLILIVFGSTVVIIKKFSPQLLHM